MSDNSKLFGLVETYFKTYQEYSKAYAKLSGNREGLLEKIKPLLEKSNSKDEDFKTAAKDYLSMVSIYPQEVNFFATKFLHAADLYLLSTGEDIPEDMAEAYMQLKGFEYKPAFSVKDGEFVRNSKVDLPEMPEQEYEMLFRFLQSEAGNLS